MFKKLKKKYLNELQKIFTGDFFYILWNPRLFIAVPNFG